MTERRDASPLAPSAGRPVPAAAIVATLESSRPALQRVLSTYDVPPQDAEDLLQEAYLTLLYKWERVECPQAWLIGTLRKKCIMYWRSRRRRLYDAMDAALLDLLVEPARPVQEGRDLCHDFERALSRLPARCQRLLRLRYVLGLGPNEAALEMGYQPSSIRKVTSRCLAALSRELIETGFLES